MRNIKQQSEKAERNRFAAHIAACSPSDFDGHTSFDQLTPSQRLDALASMARLVSEWKGLAAKRPWTTDQRQ